MKEKTFFPETLFKILKKKKNNLVLFDHKKCLKFYHRFFQ
jgi:hypothetical protein